MLMEDSDKGITILCHCRVPLTSISSQDSQMMHMHFLHNSPVSWKTEYNMQLLCIRWTWLTGKYITNGFFIFFRWWALLFSNIPFSNSIFTVQVILEDLWCSRNKQCTIGDKWAHFRDGSFLWSDSRTWTCYFFGFRDFPGIDDRNFFISLYQRTPFY